MSEYQEFTGKTVEEAIRAARDAFGASGLDELDFEILTPGSRGVLGMGAEPARIIAAPRSALGGAAPRREAAAQTPLPPPPPREPREDRPQGATGGYERRGPRPERSDRGPDRGGDRGRDRDRGYGGAPRVPRPQSADTMTGPEAAAAAGMRPPRDAQRTDRPPRSGDRDRGRGGYRDRDRDRGGERSGGTLSDSEQ